MINSNTLCEIKIKTIIEQEQDEENCIQNNETSTVNPLNNEEPP